MWKDEDGYEHAGDVPVDIDTQGTWQDDMNDARNPIPSQKRVKFTEDEEQALTRAIYILSGDSEFGRDRLMLLHSVHSKMFLGGG